MPIEQGVMHKIHTLQEGQERQETLSLRSAASAIQAVFSYASAFVFGAKCINVFVIDATWYFVSSVLALYSLSR